MWSRWDAALVRTVVTHHVAGLAPGVDETPSGASKRTLRTPPKMESERVIRRKDMTARSAGAFRIARTVRNAGCLSLGEIIQSSRPGACVGSVEPADGFWTTCVESIHLEAIEK